MRILPKRNQILGRVIDLTKSRGGIELAGSTEKGVTVFVIIDDVGPDVVGFKADDIVVPRVMNHIYLRGGQNHQVIFKDEDVVASVIDVPIEQFTIHGDRTTAPATVGASA